MTKKHLVLGVLVVIILISGCVKLPQPKPPSTPTNLSLPLGIGVWNEDGVEFFNQHAREEDFIGTWPPHIDLLDDAMIGKKALTLTGVEDLDENVALAKAKGVEIIGYNLEMALSKEELIEKEKYVYELAKQNDLLFIFAPTIRQLELNYQHFAPHADIIGLQSQRYQIRRDYEKAVEDLIGKIKAVNPDVKVLVQVSVHPPQYKTTFGHEITADEIINHIQAIEDKADAITIFYLPSKISTDRYLVMKEVFQRLRE